VAAVCAADAGADELCCAALGGFGAFQSGLLGGVWTEALCGACA